MITPEAIIFDLDGVLTDTAEYHFLAWKQLADELGIPFGRKDNEQLRGIPRRRSLDYILALDGRSISNAEAEELMTRKNNHYRTLIKQVSTKDLLPGVATLLAEIKQAGLKVAIASASKNSPQVLNQLGICDQLDALAHGGSVVRQKPHPDLFLHTARELGVPSAHCIVVEDAAAGIDAAHAAGMTAVGIGPAERVGAAEVVLPNLDGVSLADLLSATTWRVVEPHFDPAKQHHRETIFTIGNGFLGTRGSLEERYPGDRQATLVHGLYDKAPVVFTTLANAPDWTSLEIWINGRRFDMTQPGIRDYVRWLDLRDGTLNRRLVWEIDAETAVELRWTRLTNLAHQHDVAVQLSITAVKNNLTCRLRARLDGHVENHGNLHWHTMQEESDHAQASLLLQTRHTKKQLALSMNLGMTSAKVRPCDCPGTPGLESDFTLDEGQWTSFQKMIAIYSSRETNEPLAAARKRSYELLGLPFEKLLAQNRAAWDAFWQDSDVIIEGDDEAQIALRHALFQLRIAAPTHDDTVSISAKTLSGFGYSGHVFWDNEIFVLPFFTYTQPQLAKNMLLYRHHTLPGARRKAAKNGYGGAQYAWESAETGDEVTPTWVPHFSDPTQLVRIWTGDIQIHISADIAYALKQFWQVTGDDDFWRDVAAPIVLETAVFWGDRAEYEDGRFAVRDVIGPDEYHDHVDNNAFTNFILRWHLQTAQETLRWLQIHAPQQADTLTQALDLSDERLAHWQNIADNIIFLHDKESGLIEQFEGFFQRKKVDWPKYANTEKSMQVLLGIEGANKHQVLKQADVIALFCLFPNAFDAKTQQANWDYYEPITDHVYGSSLGPSMHAWAACLMNQPELGYEHFMRAARADLLNVRGNAGDGIHAASAGGLWQAVVFGFAGLRLAEEGHTINPRLPAHWQRVSFKFYRQGKQQIVNISADQPILAAS
ncbi:beta-phosphoglucomutase [Candidatus Leptofilum sp.]|uniref:beta-phosphoglucomutase n=1 Tax=Candidatus Leptofilum sp. TaxID=3241576 RepID=UPI003B5A9B30